MRFLLAITYLLCYCFSHFIGIWVTVESGVRFSKRNLPKTCLRPKFNNLIVIFIEQKFSRCLKSEIVTKYFERKKKKFAMGGVIIWLVWNCFALNFLQFQETCYFPQRLFWLAWISSFWTKMKPMFSVDYYTKQLSYHLFVL